MKKFIAGLLAGVLISSTVTIFAVGKIKSANYNVNTVTLEGKKLDLKQPLVSIVDSDSPAIESNYMPLRELLEKIDYYVEWQGDKKNINITKTKPDVSKNTTQGITKAQIDKMLPVMDSMILAESYGAKFNTKDNKFFWDTIYLLVVNNSDIHDLIKIDGDNLRIRDKAVQELATGCFYDYDDLLKLPDDTITFDKSTSEYVFGLSDRGDSYPKIDSYKILNNSEAEVIVSLYDYAENKAFSTYKFILTQNSFAGAVSEPIFELTVKDMKKA